MGLGAVFLFLQGVIGGFGALASLATASSIGHVIFMLASGSLISGGFFDAAKRTLAKALAG